MGAVDIGDVAPDFVLPGIQVVDGEVHRMPFRLSKERGHPIVLAFYPLDQSKVCTEQLCSYQDNFSGFDALGAQVWGISLQGVESHEEFARKQGLTFPLLADSRDGVAKTYGVSTLGGMLTRRSIFIVDAGGVVQWKHVAMMGLSFRKADEIREQILRLFPAPSGGAFALPAPA
ncbi:thioredoxin-dependent thiol peroxidase [Pseudolysinimonas kribbensis]|uniref:peroxiredoxin n=1 Tax=Pseudolysinimonas kribbensis TaxID=433641 RepID=UPI0024E14016|nr:peroxiredoxin [Pseudolysinimonas kribbensis]